MAPFVKINDATVKSPKSVTTVKFLCSYGGKILPRHHDGKLRYTGGDTRVVTVDRSISFPELLLKLRELNGSAVGLRCQLPQYDLDALVSITSKDDLENVIEEYDLANHALSSAILKIKVFLWPLKKVVPPTSTSAGTAGNQIVFPAIPNPFPIGFPNSFEQPLRRKVCYYSGFFQGSLGNSCLVHTGNHRH